MNLRSSPRNARGGWGGCSSVRPAGRVGSRWAFVGSLVLALVTGLRAADPRIDHIELPSSLTNYVLIHFDTEANRAYTLEYLDNSACVTSNLGLRACVPTNAVWSTLFFAEKLRFANHYVVPDSRTNQSRFYRLKATP